MRIPLDYYRILGLPIQATAEQLQQAHRDRTQQLPRREYSEAAIVARKQLLDEAYSVLSDPEQRQIYDSGFLAKTYEPETSSGIKSSISLKKEEEGAAVTDGASSSAHPQTSAPGGSAEIDPHTPSIEIDHAQFVGALLILQELGEYELVLKLGRPYLSNGSIGLKDGRFGDPQLVLPDIALTLALADLELGREQWQQGQYEKAAESLEAGQGLLLRESLFPSLRGEMQADLYKLRPYRILDLLALPEDQVTQRRRGLQILREMLEERGGIDGQGDDQSGLGIEDFLRFIQQLRRYLSTAEQQLLFEAEARRPSAVATYLAVYTLLAQGFAYRQPALIRKAKLTLMQLGRRQDVNLEKAVCALLLGQTEEASRALELSQEYEPLAFIREHSQNSPDLLPGLCLYAEHWLQEEVFPHFRDLRGQTASLKDYFADPHVQAYLEALPNEAEAVNQWVATRRGTTSAGLQPPSAVAATPTTMPATKAPFPPVSTVASQVTASTAAPRRSSSALPGKAAVGSPREPQEALPSASRRGPSTTAERRGPTPPLRRPGPKNRPASLPDFLKNQKLLLRGAGVLLAILVLLWLVMSIFGWIADVLGLSGPKLRGEHAMVSLDQPPLEIPEPPVAPTPAASGLITSEQAKEVLSQWLAVKAAALGPDHAVEQLSQILIDPALARWTQTAQSLKQEGSYRKYQHNVEVSGVEANEAAPDQAKVEAQVSERVTFYEKGQEGNSQDDSLRVQYELIRQEGQWRIRDWKVVP